MKVKCPNCGQINTEEQIDHWLSSNEEGEEFCEFDFYCIHCQNLLYEGSDWGEYDQEEAIKKINEHFKQK